MPAYDTVSRGGTVVVHHDLALNPDITRDPSGHWIRHPIALHELDLIDLQRFDVGRIRPESQDDYNCFISILRTERQ